MSELVKIIMECNACVVFAKLDCVIDWAIDVGDKKVLSVPKGTAFFSHLEQLLKHCSSGRYVIMRDTVHCST